MAARNSALSSDILGGLGFFFAIGLSNKKVVKPQMPVHADGDNPFYV